MDNIATEPILTDWVEHLALEEINMNESGVVHINDHLDPIYLLEEASIRFMDQLRENVEVYVTHFNEYRGIQNHSAQIKLFKISNTVNDFMLFRNSLRLVFARKANDLISVGFLTGNKEVFGARIGQNSVSDPYIFSVPQEIKAHIGPFNDITWRLNGDSVNLNSMIRFYLSEFIRNSAR